MIQQLKHLFSKLLKKSSVEEKEYEDEDDAVAIAYFNLYITDDNELVINSDFIDGYEEAMSKIVFLLCSGSLLETVGKVIAERCGDDKEKSDYILLSAYQMMANKIKEKSEDVDPMVDPCNVFTNNNNNDDIE